MSLNLTRIIYDQVHEISEKEAERVKAGKAAFPEHLWSPKQRDHFIQGLELKKHSSSIFNPIVGGSASNMTTQLTVAFRPTWGS